MVSSVRVTSVKSTEISLAWDAPTDPYSDIEMYEVRIVQHFLICCVVYEEQEQPVMSYELLTYGEVLVWQLCTTGLAVEMKQALRKL